MAGYIAELFGYRVDDKSEDALKAAKKQICPFLGNQCTKVLSRDRIISGVCSFCLPTTGL